MGESIEKKDWIMFFPFAEPREEQIAAINFALNAYVNEGKKYVCLELGTGIGKSGVAVTVSRFLNSLEGGGAYVLTTQKILQQQYLRDFATTVGMRSLKSADNYMCDTGYTCAVTRRVARACMRAPECAATCPYVQEKKMFLESPLGVTNYAYFMNETTYAGKLEPRNLLILDEAHTAEGVLTKFASVDISDSINRSVLGKTRVKIPFGAAQDDAFEWISNDYRKSLANGKLKLQRDIAKGKVRENAERYERMDKHLCRVNRFVEKYKPEDWIYCEEEGRSGKVMSFKPIRVDGVSQETLFERGKYVLMLSATILSKETYCKWLGLKSEDVAYMNIDCPFPLENRPVHYLPVGKMNRNEIDTTLPKMVEIVRGLLDLHKGEKGIIHATSHKVARYIKEKIKDPRLLYREDGDRDEMLREHSKRTDASVMLSPSMTEGVDLVDDLSRFQIFVKIPFPNLGDAVIAKRMQLDSKWYALETTRTMVQGVGRSIRNMEDRATTYILDESFSYFYEKNKDMFPESFRKALK
jgi:Rad3-related DNA helicase